MSAGIKGWFRQRVSAIALIPLSAWLLWAGASLAGADYAAASAFFASPVNAVAAALLAVIGLFHTLAGVTVIIEDYAPRALHTLLVWVARIGCTVGALVVIWTVTKFSLGA